MQIAGIISLHRVAPENRCPRPDEMAGDTIDSSTCVRIPQLCLDEFDEADEPDATTANRTCQRKHLNNSCQQVHLGNSRGVARTG